MGICTRLSSLTLILHSYYFALEGSSVKIFATSTGQLVSTLSSPPSSTGALAEALTSVVLNPQNIFQIITGSLDGLIRIWDYLDATLIKTMEIGQPIHYISTHPKYQDYIFVSATRPNKQKKKACKLHLSETFVVLLISCFSRR